MDQIIKTGSNILFFVALRAHSHLHHLVHILQVPPLAIHPPAQLVALLAVHLVGVQAAVAVSALPLVVANPALHHAHLAAHQAVQVTLLSGNV